MTVLPGASSRWTAALVISVALHCLLFFVSGALPDRTEEKPETPMNVKLVFAPEKPKPKPEPVKIEKKETVKEAAPKSAPPKKTEIKKARPVEVPKKTTEAPVPVRKPQEISAEKAEDIAPAAESPAPQAEESAASGTSDSDRSTADAGSGTAGASGNGEASAPSGGIADVSTLTVTHKVIPEYPSFSRKRREEGTVIVIASVDNGSVTSAEVEKTSGFERLDAAALRAVKGWRFAYDGKIRVRIPFAFRIK
ncbi:MAG: energy transducer TonB [Synergistes sp.]|nr:energy transducer TonB [Synergistes sp.]